MSEPKNAIISWTENHVGELIETGKLDLPAGYSASNALKSAWLLIQDMKMGKQHGYKPVLEVCSRPSIMQALLDMVFQALDPVKKQCYFIPHGKELTLRRSYFGNLHLAQRDGGVTEVRAHLIHEGDVFEYHIEQGRMVIDKHEQQLGNIDRPFIGGYAFVFKGDRVVDAELMTLAQIQKAWAQGGDFNPAQVNFPDQMALRTVINRAIKRVVSASGANYVEPDEPIQEPVSQFEAAVMDVEAVENAPVLEMVEDDLPDAPEWGDEE